MSELSASSALFGVAAMECLGAAAVLPQAALCVTVIEECQADAGSIDDAGATWRDVHRALGEAAAELQRLVAAVPDDSWSGKDRSAYEGRIAEFGRQLHDAATFAETGGIALSTLAFGLFAVASFAYAVGTELAAVAVEVAMADATVVGAPEAEAVGTAFAMECYGELSTAKSVLEAAMNAGAGVFTLTELLDVGEQLRHGSHTVLPDFVQAEVSSRWEALKSDLEELPREAIEAVTEESEPDGPEDLPDRPRGRRG